MRTLEEVIQNKFLITNKYNRHYTMRVPDGNLDGLSLFAIDDMECENSIEFLKLVTPFLCYICSLLKYEDENLYINMKITIKLSFHLSDCEYHIDILKINDNNGIETIKDIIQSLQWILFNIY